MAHCLALARRPLASVTHVSRRPRVTSEVDMSTYHSPVKILRTASGPGNSNFKVRDRSLCKTSFTLFSKLMCYCSFGDNIKRVARQVQGALPLVGLLSRLTSPSGGIGKDMLVSTVVCVQLTHCFKPANVIRQHVSPIYHCMQSYPEFCRATFDLAPGNFLTICEELQKAYGKVGVLVKQLSSNSGVHLVWQNCLLAFCLSKTLLLI